MFHNCGRITRGQHGESRRTKNSSTKREITLNWRLWLRRTVGAGRLRRSLVRRFRDFPMGGAICMVNKVRAAGLRIYSHFPRRGGRSGQHFGRLPACLPRSVIHPVRSPYIATINYRTQAASRALTNLWPHRAPEPNLLCYSCLKASFSVQTEQVSLLSSRCFQTFLWKQAAAGGNFRHPPGRPRGTGVARALTPADAHFQTQNSFRDSDSNHFQIQNLRQFQLEVR